MTSEWLLRKSSTDRVEAIPQDEMLSRKFKTIAECNLLTFFLFQTCFTNSITY